MREVPRWYAWLAHALAVALSLWVGLHYRAGADWLALFGAAAIASAVVPARRAAGAFAVIIGLAVAGAGAYLMKDARHAIALGDVLDARGGILAPAREACALVATTTWLLAGGALRFRWT